MRLSQSMVSDSQLKWEGGVDEARQRFRALADAGLDYLHVTEPDAAAPAFGDGPSFAAIAKGSVSIPVIGNGGIVTGEQAEKLLTQGDMDLVAVGTVADLVALDANNRALVAAGLRRLRAATHSARHRAERFRRFDVCSHGDHHQRAGLA